MYFTCVGREWVWVRLIRMASLQGNMYTCGEFPFGYTLCRDINYARTFERGSLTALRLHCRYAPMMLYVQSCG